ncbi:hypothetical protein LPJ70_003465 [Coemansia sp. RSA 2708]|nr:hypothetical protein LPJ70_003465 [Coemansia sp. RSA 2708]
MPPIKPTLSREAKNATRGKKGKSFTTKNSMLDILDQVNQAEEARVNKKLERQHTIKKLVDEREVRTAEKKKKKTSRLEAIKNQLRQGHQLGTPNKPAKMPRKPKNIPRTLSSVNREWSSAFEDGSSAESPDHDTSSAKPKKTVSFAV